MKLTNPSSTLRVTVSLGILGLNEDFVQLNEVMMAIVFYINFDMFKRLSFIAFI
jgi:hypothetical protein